MRGARLLVVSFLSFLLVAFVAASRADTIVHVTNLTGLGPNVFLDWGSVAPNFGSIPNPDTIDSHGGSMLTISTGSSFQRMEERNGWDSIFNQFDHVLWNQGPGPMEITFLHPLSAVGVAVTSDNFGAFSGTMVAFDQSGVSIGSVTESGFNTTQGPGGSAPFLGLKDLTGPGISSVAISTTNDSTGYGLDTLELQVAPLPASVWTGLALLSCLAAVRWCRQRRSVSSGPVPDTEPH